MRIEVKADRVRYHRNGVCGEGFFTVTFKHNGQHMLGIVFGGGKDEDERGYVSVVDLHDPHNTWRGDNFEDALREAVAEWCEPAEGKGFGPAFMDDYQLIEH